MNAPLRGGFDARFGWTIRGPLRRARPLALLGAATTLILGVFALGFAPSPAQAQTTYGEEAKTRLQLAERVAPLTEDSAFGERIGQFNGSLNFRYVDVSLPGNDGLKVEFARVANGEYSPNFWGWDIDIPKITSVMPRNWTQGWTPDPPASVENDRNVEFMRNDYWNGFRMRVDGQTSPLLYRSSQAGQLPSDSRTPVGPSPGGQWRFMTKAGWLFRAVPAQGRPGSSLIARAPDGLTYHFDHLVKFQHDTVQHPTKMRVSTASGPGYTVSTVDPEVLGRDIYVLYVSKIEDRFGSAVHFDWAGPKLQRIRHATDGRVIEITSRKLEPGLSDEQDPRYEVSAISVNGRTWSYTQSNKPGPLIVTNPDGSTWQYSGAGWREPMPIAYDRTRYEGGLNPVQVPNLVEIGFCTKAYPITANQQRTMSVTAPSGARAEYLLEPVRHGRSKTAALCREQSDDATRTTMIPRFVDEWTLRQKSVSGPGLAAINTSYSYSGLSLSYDPSATLFAPPSEIWNAATETDVRKTVTATRSDGEVRRYVFGRNYGEDEGLLLAEEVLGPEAGAGLEEKPGRTTLKRFRRTEYSHVLPAQHAGQAFAASWGFSNIGFGDDFNNLHTPVRKTTVLQDDVQFSSEVLSFDRYVSPTSVRKQSTNMPGFSGYVGYTKTETYQNYNNEAVWVLGQPETFSVNGTMASRTVYDPVRALPQYVYRFNEAQPSQTLVHNAQGQVESVTDARNKVTTLTNWKRGIPRNIGFHNGTTVSAIVDDNGWVERVTDQLGHSTCYGYDPMGRVNLVRRPGDSTCAVTLPGQRSWAPTSITFAPSPAPAWGLPIGHWVRTESRGIATGKSPKFYNKVTRYDAFWRPVMEREWDNTREADTQRYRGWRYDTAGRQTFVADPRSAATNLSSFADVGVTTEFDALGRPTRSHRPSELGVNLETRYAYLPAFRSQVTNPRSHVSTTHFQAYDAPDTSMPVRIEAPEGATTLIARDVYGKPTSITRSGVYGAGALNVTRNYVYDSLQRLCKRVEPETGATVMDYDPAGNLLWSASGLGQTGLICDRGSVTEARKVRRSYDDLNRLQSLTFPDGLGNQTWVYTADGLPETVTTQNAGGASVVNTYAYNNLRLLDSESMSQSDGVFWSLTYGYDALAYLNSHVHPTGLSVSYAPNALGQATQAGSYATTARYYPNGALRTFNYGNGLVHTMDQNARGLPERSRATGLGVTALDDTYDYDENGNVAGISDALPGQRGDRSMDYDGLDRLTETTSPMFGVATYGYDPLDNLRRVAVSQGTRSRDNTYVYDAQQRLSSVTTTSSGLPVLALGYDAQGNLSSRAGQAFSFDFGNRLREVPGVEQYRYDAHGRRIRAVSPTQGSIHSMYGNDGVLRFQRDERANKATDFVYLAGSMVARVSNPITTGPQPPSITAPATSTGSYTLSWNQVIGANHYRLEERVGSGSFEEIQSNSLLSRTLTSKPSGTYAYRARACTSSLVSSCGVYSATVQVVVGTVPPVPTLTAPTNSPNGSYALSWTASAGATVYRLEQQSAGVWSEIQNAANTQRDITGQPAGTYAYRVRACSSGVVTSCSAYSNTATVSVGLPPPPLSAPSTSGTGSYVVSWSAVNGALRYRLEEQSNGGAWSEVQTSNVLSRPVSGKPDGLYGYRVRACSSDALSSCGGYSNVVSVSVSMLPTAPVLSAPASNITGSYSVSWTTPAGASFYRLDERINGGAWQQVQAGTGNSRDFSGKPNGSYEYRARACRSTQEAECGDYSATLTVVVNLIPLPPAPVLSAPGSSSTGSYGVSWTSSSGATYYRLEEQANGGAWFQLQSGASTSLAVSGRGSGSYAYRARACRTSLIADCGAYSNVAVVSVSIIAAPAAPVLSGLSTQTTDFPFTLSWTASTGASYYELEARRNGGVWQQDYVGPATSNTRQEFLVGSYQYRVRACAGSACSAFSNEHTVAITGIGGNPPPPASYLSGPASSGGSHSLSWTASSGATRYRLEEQQNGGGWGELVSHGSTSFSVSGRADGSWGYRVRACLGSELASCSGYSNIVVVQVGTVPPPPPPAAPMLSAPASSDTGSYTVSWSNVSGANRYRLEELANGGSWAEVQNGSAVSAPLSGRANGSYSYRVRACSGTDPSSCGDYSAVALVSVSIPGAQIPASTSLSGPTDSTTSFPFTLTWGAVTGASYYEIEQNRNGGDWSQSYSGSALQRSFQEFLGGNYRYRVRACSAAGCSAWSAAHSVYVTATLD